MRLLKIASLFSLAFFLAGCIEFEMIYTLKPDGSGSKKMCVKMDKETLDTMKEMRELAKESGQKGQMKMEGGEELFQLFELQKEDLEAKLKKYDLQLTSFKKSEKDGKVGLDVEIAFKDWRKMEEYSATEEKDAPTIITRNEDGSYWLRKGGKSPEKKKAEEGESKEEEEIETGEQNMEKAMEMMQKSMALMQKLMAKMNDLKIDIRFSVPGTVVKHNGQKLEGSTVMWSVKGQEMMMQNPGSMEPDITFKGEEISLKVGPLEK